MSRNVRTYAQIGEPTGADIPEQIEGQLTRLQNRLQHIRNIIVIASGKGGVGKSFITAQVATMLAASGRAVGVLDADLNGPSVASMLGAEPSPLRVGEEGVHPARTRAGCRVISSSLLLGSADAPMQWHAPRGLEFLTQSVLETGAIREFISDVAWGELDALIIDLPPGTDKIERIVNLLPRISLFLIVTTPSLVTHSVVARSIAQLRSGAFKLGLVCNMDSYTCPHCHTAANLFAHDVPAELADDLWARIPFEPDAALRTDSGSELPRGSAAARALAQLVHRIEQETL